MGQIWPRPEAPQLAAETEWVDLIVIEKSARRLTTFRQGTTMAGFDIALGFAPIGNKNHEGDGKTPEGRFVINRRDPASAFSLSLGIDYPQQADIKRAAAQGIDPGADIFIHGQPNGIGHLMRLPGDWTAGCIAISNTQITALWRITPIGTTVEIKP